MVADDSSGRPPERRSAGVRVLVGLAVAAACAAGVLLGVRKLTTPDLGYHLAYGEEMLRTGRAVDHNGFIYTLPPTNLPPAERPEAGPGCWYDEHGRYRFPNANWLTQVIMAAVKRAGGLPALSLLLPVLVASLVAATVAALRRVGVS